MLGKETLIRMPPIKEVFFGGEHYLLPTYDQLDRICFDLANAMVAAGYKPDWVIPIKRGGSDWVRKLSDYLGGVPYSEIQIEYYGKHLQRGQRKPLIRQPLLVDISEKKVLIFDDVADTGETGLFAGTYVDAHGPESIKTATLFVKPGVGFLPDFHGPTVMGWIIFPTETGETIAELTKNWTAKGISETEILARLQKLFSVEQLNFFLKEASA